MSGQGTSHPRKRYDAEFKRESVRLADTSGKTDRQIERDLGLYQGAILRWRDELEADTRSMRSRAQVTRSLWRRRFAGYFESLTSRGKNGTS